MNEENYKSSEIDINKIPDEVYYGEQGNPASTQSLSNDFENDFLKINKRVISFSGGNGVWKVKIAGSLHDFKVAVKAYGKTRIYMHFDEIQLLSNVDSTALVTLLGS